MFINKSAIFTVLFALSVMPFTGINAAELSDNDPNIIEICNCVESPEAAKSGNCQKLFAEMFPEESQQHARVPASHNSTQPN